MAEEYTKNDTDTGLWQYTVTDTGLRNVTDTGTWLRTIMDTDTQIFDRSVFCGYKADTDTDIGVRILLMPILGCVNIPKRMMIYWYRIGLGYIYWHWRNTKMKRPLKEDERHICLSSTKTFVREASEIPTGATILRVHMAPNSSFTYCLD